MTKDSPQTDKTEEKVSLKPYEYPPRVYLRGWDFAEYKISPGGFISLLASLDEGPKVLCPFQVMSVKEHEAILADLTAKLEGAVLAAELSAWQEAYTYTCGAHGFSELRRLFHHKAQEVLNKLKPALAASYRGQGEEENG